VRKKYRLSHAQIQMARELGLNPKKFGKLANYKQQPWKAPLPDFIEDIYFKHFGKRKPDQIRSVEQVFKAQEKKKVERRARKQLKRQRDAETE
jgi:phage terminase small subunit